MTKGFCKYIDEYFIKKINYRFYTFEHLKRRPNPNIFRFSFSGIFTYFSLLSYAPFIRFL